MTTMADNAINREDLQKIYASDAEARAVLDHFANRERNQNISTVPRLTVNIANDGLPLSRGAVVRILKELEQLDCGEFKAGRKGYESRFEWHFSSKSIGQVASGENTDIEPSEEDNQDEATDELLEHRFQLRPTLSVTINLPSDISSREAKRLSTFIEALPFMAEEQK